MSGAVAGQARLPYLVVALIVTTTLSNVAQSVLPVVAPVAARTYGLPASLIGYQIALVTFGTLISLAVLGNLSARWGGARVAQAAALIQAASLALALVPDLKFLLVASLGMGIGYGLLTPAASTLLMRFAPPAQRNLIFSLQQTGVPLGMVLAAACAPAVTVSLGWQWALAGSAVLLALAALVTQPGRGLWDAERDRHAPTTRNPLPALRTVARHPRLRRMIPSAVCFAACQFAFATYTVVALVEGLGFGLVSAGLVMVASQLAGVACRPFTGWLADRLRNAVLVLAGLASVSALLCASIAPMSTAWPAVLIVALFTALGASINGHPGPFLAEVARLAPHGEVSSTISGMLIYSNVGKMLGPVAFAQVFLASGSYVLTIASMGLLALVSALTLAHTHRQARA